MNYYEVLPNKVARTDSHLFVYHSDINFTKGDLVELEIGRSKCLGVIINQTSRPSFKTKEVSKLLKDSRLTVELITLLFWISDYYCTHPSIVLGLMLPSGLNKSRRKKPVELSVVKHERTNLLLNDQQKTVVSAISDLKSGSVILQGITGSGKTAIYIELAKKAEAAGKSSIILVPEIGLTSQIVSEFSKHFSVVKLVHSQLTEADKHVLWSDISDSKKPMVIIGARSALFSPVAKLGLIVVDEFHEPSYKQEKSPKYSSIRVASVLGKLTDSLIVFGSATPTVSERFIAESGNHPIIRLDIKAKTNVRDASVSIIDMRDKTNHKKYSYLSDKLLDGIESSLENGKQSLIYHNRRGSRNMTLCQNCGWNALCKKCLIPMTLHSDLGKLKCRVCMKAESIPVSCPLCHEPDIIHRGIGTKQIELDLIKLFPRATIARFDSDNTKAQRLNNRFDDVIGGKIDILIGTQILAKGLDLPKLETVGVIQADSGLALPDYQSRERTFQLLAQVAGRVGRHENESRLIIQTYQPDHPSVVFGASQNYEEFYSGEILQRKKSNFPPFCYLLLLTCSYKNEKSAINNATKLMDKLAANRHSKNVEILGPTPAFHERLGGNYRWQIIIKSKKRSTLIELLKLVPKNNWQVDLDPSSLI